MNRDQKVSIVCSIGLMICTIVYLLIHTIPKDMVLAVMVTTPPALAIILLVRVLKGE